MVDLDTDGTSEYILGSGRLYCQVRVEVLMRLLTVPKDFFHGFKSIYGKVAAPKKTQEPSEAPLFDSGLSSIGNWLLDLVVLALIALVVGSVLKWAYLALFHK